MLARLPVDFLRSESRMPFGSSASHIVRPAQFQASQGSFHKAMREADFRLGGDSVEAPNCKSRGVNRASPLSQ